MASLGHNEFNIYKINHAAWAHNLHFSVLAFPVAQYKSLRIGMFWLIKSILSKENMGDKS